MNRDSQDNIYYTNIVLDNEFKELIYKQIKYAQDEFHPHYLSNLTAYSCYHAPLEIYFKKKYNKSLTKPDKLAFLLLLTYPIHVVRTINSVRDIKLKFESEQSDFQICGEKIITKDNMNDYENDDFEGGLVNTCICSKRIQNIYIIQNKYNNITVQVGCDCIEKNGLVSRKEIQIYKKKIEILREHEKEKIENKPEGYYEKLRQEKKQNDEENKKLKYENKKLKYENKLMLEEEKLRKNVEKHFVNELKRLNKEMRGTYVSKKCYFCKSETIFKNTEKILLCSKCCSQTQRQNKERINHIVKKIIYCTKCKLPFENNIPFNTLCYTCHKLKECVNCEKDFNGQSDLCPDCDKIYKMKKCQLCPFNFIVSHKNNDLYCDECDKNIIKCIDCKREMLKNSTNNNRCNTCDYNFINKIIVKICKCCEGKFPVKENLKWKPLCPECCSKPDNNISVECKNCGNSFERLKIVTWMNHCNNCYKKK